jgi:hypothetical protein
MSENEWNEKVKQVLRSMTSAVYPYLTPISAEVEQDWGELVGSGTYISYNGQVFVVTNAHVLYELKGRRGGYHLRESMDDDVPATVVALEKPFGILTSPSDIAVVKVSPKAWKQKGTATCAVPFDRFSGVHAPVERELLFFIGFSGERSKSLHSMLATRGTPYTSQQPEGAAAPDYPEHEFHVLYPIGLIETLGDDERGAPLPPGFSGSLVWNTRYVETTQNGGEWTPANAVVTGILKRWIEKEELLTATKIEKTGFQGLFEAVSAGLRADADN